MSREFSSEHAVVSAAKVVSGELPIAFRAFAAVLGPQVTKRDKHGHAAEIAPGSADEVWLKHIKIQHGKERHTLTEWRALIDKYRNQPAYRGV
jgi:hypothetical protein